MVLNIFLIALGIWLVLPGGVENYLPANLQTEKLVNLVDAESASPYGSEPAFGQSVTPSCWTSTSEETIIDIKYVDSGHRTKYYPITYVEKNDQCTTLTNLEIPNLPAGITHGSDATGIFLEGSDTITVTALTSYTASSTGWDGTQKTWDFDLEVEEDAQPGFWGESTWGVSHAFGSDRYVWTKDVPVAPFHWSDFIAERFFYTGNLPNTYSFRGDARVPGITIDPVTGRISGTPTEVTTSPIQLLISIRDLEGDSSTLPAIAITVREAVVPTIKTTVDGSMVDYSNFGEIPVAASNPQTWEELVVDLDDYWEISDTINTDREIEYAVEYRMETDDSDFPNIIGFDLEEDGSELTLTALKLGEVTLVVTAYGEGDIPAVGASQNFSFSVEKRHPFAQATSPEDVTVPPDESVDLPNLTFSDLFSDPDGESYEVRVGSDNTAVTGAYTGTNNEILTITVDNTASDGDTATITLSLIDAPGDASHTFMVTVGTPPATTSSSSPSSSMPATTQSTQGSNSQPTSPPVTPPTVTEPSSPTTDTTALGGQTPTTLAPSTETSVPSVSTSPTTVMGQTTVTPDTQPSTPQPTSPPGTQPTVSQPSTPTMTVPEQGQGGGGQNQSPSTQPSLPSSSQPSSSSSSQPGSVPSSQPTATQPSGGGVVNQPSGGGPSGGGGGGGSPSVVVTTSGDPAQSGGVSFSDTVGTTHEDNIGRLAEGGITRGCNPPENSRFCPDRPVTRGEMATFMVRAFNLAESSSDLFGDDNGNTHESNINALATAEITRGCNPPENSRYCPDRPVTRAQMATFLARAMELAEGSGEFSDTGSSPHESDINRIASVGITRGCNPPVNSRFCPDRAVTRGEMATFLIRAEDLPSS